MTAAIDHQPPSALMHMHTGTGTHTDTNKHRCRHPHEHVQKLYKNINKTTTKTLECEEL